MCLLTTNRGALWATVDLMHPRQQLAPSLSETIRLQAGVLSARQALESGMSDKVLRRHASAWTRLGSGLWCAGEVTWASMAYAGLLRGGAGAVLGGLAAAHLWGVADLAPEELTVWTPRGAGRRALESPPWRIRFREGERSGRGEPLRSLMEQTVLDVAGEADEDTTVSVLTRAFAQRLTSPTRVMALARSGRLRHRRVIEQLCDASMEGIESALEFRYHAVVEGAHGLPKRQRQRSLSFGTRSDGYYAEFGVIIELDGRTGHERWHRDMARDNRHALLGHGLTLRYGWFDVIHRPCEVAQQVGAALRQRGWLGDVRRCTRCRRIMDRDFRP